MKHQGRLEDPAMLATMVVVGPLAIIGLGLGWVFLRAWYKQHKPFKHFQHDMKHVNSPHRCASCGGQATELDWQPQTGVHICKDRATCRQTLIWRSQLDSMS